MHKKQRQRVLFIATVYTHIASFHLPYIQLLQGLGCDVHVAASPVDGRKEDVEATGATTWEIPFVRSPYSLANLYAFRRLKQLLKKNHYDLIHVHTPVAAFLARYLAKSTGQGHVLYTAHGFHFYNGAPIQNWLIYYTAERIATRWTDAIVVMNNEDYTNACRLGFEPHTSLFYVHGVGVDLGCHPPLSAMGSVREELSLGQTEVLVACVAEFNPNKNHCFLLEAWKHVSSRRSNAHLLLVGKGSNEAKLKRKVQSEQISNVHFLGYRNDVPQILHDANIATLVSKREGLPKCIMEAMAASKPVVATNVRGSRDLVEHGQTGLLVDIGDVEGLAAALESLIASPDMQAAMGRAGYNKVKAYAIEQVLAEIGDIYQRYLDL